MKKTERNSCLQAPGGKIIPVKIFAPKKPGLCLGHLRMKEFGRWQRLVALISAIGGVALSCAFAIAVMFAKR
jgi:hypothetical protein